MGSTNWKSTREYSNLSQEAPWNKKLARKTNMHQDLAEISVDDILKQTVHMNIVVEEEPEDD